MVKLTNPCDDNSPGVEIEIFSGQPKSNLEYCILTIAAGFSWLSEQSDCLSQLSGVRSFNSMN